LLPLLVLAIVSVAAGVLAVTERTIRRDLFQRGAAVGQMVALSAAHSLLSEDRLALHRLTAETKESAPDVEYVAVRDTAGRILSHNRVERLGTLFEPPERSVELARVGDTVVEDVIREGHAAIEFTSPVLFAGKRIGMVSLGLSRESYAGAQRQMRRSIGIAAALSLAVAFAGALLLASRITTPVKNLTAGVAELAAGTFHPIPVRARDELGQLTQAFNRMAETILAQKDRLKEYARDLEEAYVGLVRVIAASIDARDPYTLGHSARVARLAGALGRRLGLSSAEIDDLEKACLFHDVGKIRTPDRVLQKGQSLDLRETELMRTHPVDGAEILALVPSLRRYIPAVLYHHEWYDGSGYPEGRRGDDIPLHAQIIALADAFDAMTTTRPYRKALSVAEAVEELEAFRGTQFSPELTDAFVETVRDMAAVEVEDLRGLAL